MKKFLITRKTKFKDFKDIAKNWRELKKIGEFVKVELFLRNFISQKN